MEVKLIKLHFVVNGGEFWINPYYIVFIFVARDGKVGTTLMVDGCDERKRKVDIKETPDEVINKLKDVNIRGLDASDIDSEEKFGG